MHSHIVNGRIIKLEGVTNTGPVKLRDAQGNVLTGTVWGIAKYAGQWTNNMTMQSNTISQGEEFCNQIFGSARTTVNANSSNFTGGKPLLSCNGISFKGPFDPSYGDGVVVSNKGLNLEEGVIGPKGIVFDDNNFLNGDVYEAVNLLGELQNDEVSNGFNWPQYVKSFSIYSVFHNADEIVLTEEDLLLPNGEYNFPVLNLQRGLYMVQIQYVDNSFSIDYFESRISGNVSYPLSNLLDVTIFPVPIQGDQFDMQLSASAKLKFEYILQDLNGNIIFRRNFVIQKDHSRTHKITVPNGQGGIPEGQLVNTFLFEDGSSIVFQTIK